MENIINWLKENMSEERYLHSVGTAKMAKKLAQQFGLDENKAELAGLLHDCAKEFSYEKMLQIAKDNNLDIPNEELNSKKVLHAPLSAYWAKEYFKVIDEEILSAIRWHTIGRVGMLDFEKIIFLADKIELNTRIEPHFQLLRDELKKTNDLDKTLLLCSKMTIKSLIDRDLPINYATIEVYNYLISVSVR